MPDINAEWHTMNIIIEDLKEQEGLSLEHIQKSDPPAPDFLIEVKADTIGVEVTRFSAQGDQFESNSLVDRALECGRQVFRDNGGPALYVSLHFSREPETKRQADSIGKNLARIVRFMYDRKIMENDAGCDETLFDNHGLLDYVSAIRVYSVDVEDEPWKSPRVGWVASVSAEEVQKVIDEKNEKLSDYRKNCKSVWLAIHNCLEAGFYELSDEAMQFNYRHDFERIFWIDWPDKVYELNKGSENNG